MIKQKLTSRTFHGCIWYFKYFGIKDRGLLEVSEPVTEETFIETSMGDPKSAEL